MSKKVYAAQHSLSCKLPRKPEAKEALLGLIWKKQKTERPEWILEELKNLR